MTDYNIGQWHIVINTNKKVENTPESRRLVRKFTRVIQDVFSEENADDMLRIFQRGKNRDPIYSIQLTSSIEQKLRLTYDRLRGSVEEALGIPIHFNAKFLDKKQTLEQMQQNQINYVLKEYLGIDRKKKEEGE
ncbi:hypothetical protein QOT17_001527 [Balamuthia mandrillaris]